MIVILRFDPIDGPSYLGTWLRARGVAHRLIDAWREPVPASIDGIRALAALGGPMSVNDDLPMLRATEALMRDAVAHDVPVLGHCLGGQLLAHAHGATVRRNPVPEIGWQPIAFDDHPVVAQAFGAVRTAHLFEWHVDTFDIPPGAQRIAGSAHCTNQAFVLGASIGMQFHIEIDAPTIHAWQAQSGSDVDALGPLPSVQPLTAQTAGIAHHLDASQRMAAHLYAHWLEHAGIDRVLHGAANTR